MIAPVDKAAPTMGGPVRCTDCGFWAHFNNQVGVCRRRAPRPTAGTDHDSVSHWPETYAGEGCGDGIPAVERAISLVCADCAFWWQAPSGAGLDPIDMNDQPRAWWRSAGRCTRHAPMPTTNPGTRLVWPATHSSDACGEGLSNKVAVPKPA